jgi:hydroxypyruvate isomerase
VVLFTAPLGDFMTGGEGLAAVPGRQQQFRQSVATALEYAEALNSDYVQFVAGRCESADPRVREQYLATYVDNLDYATEAFAGLSTELLIEPINSVKFNNFLIDTPAMARQLSSGLSLIFDTVHLALMGIDPVQEWLQHSSAYAHIQLADSPDRTLPGTGTVDFPQLCECVNKSDYGGWIGAEYWPANSSEETRQALESGL